MKATGRLVPQPEEVYVARKAMKMPRPVKATATVKVKAPAKKKKATKRARYY